MKTRPLSYAILLTFCLCLLMVVAAGKEHSAASAASEDSLLLNAALTRLLGARLNEASPQMKVALTKIHANSFEGFVVERHTALPAKSRQSLYPAADGYKWFYEASDGYKDPKRATPQDAQHAFKDFERRNTVPHVIPTLSLRRPLIIVENREITALFQHGGWEEGWEAFNRKYPTDAGYLTVTLPGYSIDHTVAAVYIEYGSRGLDGVGAFLLLKKSNGKWTLVRQFVTWES